MLSSSSVAVTAGTRHAKNAESTSCVEYVENTEKKYKNTINEPQTLACSGHSKNVSIFYKLSQLNFLNFPFAPNHSPFAHIFARFRFQFWRTCFIHVLLSTYFRPEIFNHIICPILINSIDTHSFTSQFDFQVKSISSIYLQFAGNQQNDFQLNVDGFVSSSLLTNQFNIFRVETRKFDILLSD